MPDDTCPAVRIGTVSDAPTVQFLRQLVGKNPPGYETSWKFETRLSAGMRWAFARSTAASLTATAASACRTTARAVSLSLASAAANGAGGGSVSAVRSAWRTIGVVG